jgi:hypothetical protein
MPTGPQIQSAEQYIIVIQNGYDNEVTYQDFWNYARDGNVNLTMNADFNSKHSKDANLDNGSNGAKMLLDPYFG